jgi:hypothetical protein
MFETQVVTLLKERSGIIRFTCWATWVFVVPIIVILMAKMSGLPGFWNAPNVEIAIPLPFGIVALLLFLVSTIGLWQMQPWGVYLYGFAGLLSVILMNIHFNADMTASTHLPNAFQWVLVGLVHVLYTLRLWKDMLGR